MALFVAGLSHRTAPVELREQVALEDDKLREVLRELQASGVVDEAVLLSTCNRVELYAVAAAPGEARARCFRILGEQRGVPLGRLEPVLYQYEAAEAVRHVFRVAASLDSMLIGEPQILGQVKSAFELAQASELVGPALHALFARAFGVAKRVRTETGIGRHAVSASFAAVELARKIFSGIEGRAVLLVGTGKMGGLAARQLAADGAYPLYVANRTGARAHEAARALGGRAVPFEELDVWIGAADIVITSTAAPEPIVTRESVQRALHGRRSRPLFFVDLAVPRNVAPGVGELPDVYCYDIDDLQQVVDANLRERGRAAQRGEAIVEREVGSFLARLAEAEVVPTIVSLRDRLEAIRAAEVERTLGRLPGASPETRAAIEALSSAIVSKVLHAPITKLRESSRAGAARRWIEHAQELFGLGRRG